MSGVIFAVSEVTMAGKLPKVNGRFLAGKIS